MEDNIDDFPDVPLENFGAETNVTTPPVEETKTAPDATATGSDATQTAQPADANDNSKAEDKSEQAPAENGKPPEGDSKVEDATAEQSRPEKKDRVQNRIGDLSHKLSEQGQYIQKLEEQLAQNQAQSKVQPLQPDENGYIDPNALQQNINQQIEARLQAERQVAQNQQARLGEAQRFEREEQQIVSKWAELREPTADNPNPDFNPKMFKAVQSAIEAAALPRAGSVDALKEVSPYQIAKTIMDGYEEARAQASARTQQNLEQIQADSADMPNENKTTPVDNDSVEALEARLADIKF